MHAATLGLLASIYIIVLNYLSIYHSSPTPDQRRDVCRAIITVYPHQADADGGYVSTNAVNLLYVLGNWVRIVHACSHTVQCVCT